MTLTAVSNIRHEWFSNNIVYSIKGGLGRDTYGMDYLEATMKLNISVEVEVG